MNLKGANRYRPQGDAQPRQGGAESAHLEDGGADPYAVLPGGIAGGDATGGVGEHGDDAHGLTA